jgi:hypothetical protein
MSRKQLIGITLISALSLCLSIASLLTVGYTRRRMS